MKKLALSLGMVSLWCLGSCCTYKTYNINDYTKQIKFKENFSICMLEDIQLSSYSNLEQNFELIDKIIRSYSPYFISLPDLIILNGDSFQNASKKVVTSFFSFLDNYNIPFCFNYGNHDQQGIYESNFIEKSIKRTTNGILINPENDDVYGNSNYIIDLVDDFNKTVYQLYFIDSNSYYKGGYDVIHDDQISWYERAIKETNDINDGTDLNSVETITSLMFFHIPLLEYEIVSKDETLLNNKDHYVDFHEPVSHGYKKTSLLETISKYHSTAGVFASHNHINRADMWYQENSSSWPIRLIYGEKSSYESYCDIDMIGGLFISLFSSPKFSSVDNNNLLYFGVDRIDVKKDNNGIYQRSVVCQNSY